MDVDQIRDRLTSFVRDDLRIHFVEISAEQWLELPLAPVYRFGWIPPANLHDPVRDDQLILMFSPELLAQVVAVADDEAMAEAYLTVVEAVLSHTVARRHDLRADEMSGAIDDLFWDEAPAGLAVRSAVEMAALDAGVVPIRH